MDTAKVMRRPTGVTIDDARTIVAALPRSYEALVRDQVKFRVGQIVYAAFSPDDTVMGFAFPREEREALVASEPDKFLMPRPSDMRYRWVRVRLDAIDVDELHELLVEACACASPRRWLPRTRGERCEVAGTDVTSDTNGRSSRPR